MSQVDSSCLRSFPNRPSNALSLVCPTCNSHLDPVHAPVARIRGSKVVTYCSASCANASHEVSATIPEAVSKENSEESLPEPRRVSASAGLPSGVRSPEEPLRIEEPPSEPVAVGDHSEHQKEPEDPRGVLLRPISSSLRKRVLLSCGAIMAGGIAVAIIESISPTSPSAVSAEAWDAKPSASASLKVLLAPRDRDAEEDSGALQPKALDPVQMESLAVAELEAQLRDGSSRSRRLAGLALARISSREALDTLKSLLRSESSDLSRIDIAYGLALGGEPSGSEYLHGELKSKRRDVRMDAAKRLVQLGDDSGQRALRHMLSVRSHRLGAASLLALLGDKEGLSVLRDTLASGTSSDEARMRAAVGLGFAGDAQATSLLRTILSEGKYVVDAAGALAKLGDSAAIPALRRQLQLTSLRVGAAESLRAMDVDVELSPLLSALVKSNSEGRISAAEAILVLVK